MTRKFFSQWIPIFVTGTILICIVYVAFQQMYRQSANDGGIEFATNAVALLQEGLAPQSLLSGVAQVDMSVSESIFGMIFDANGKLISTNAVIGPTFKPDDQDKPFLPPAGIFGWAKAHGEDRVTWQTRGGLRFAAIVEPWTATVNGSTTSGFFLAARSLSQTEAHIKQLGFLCLIGWLMSVVGSVVAVWIGVKIEKK